MSIGKSDFHQIFVEESPFYSDIYSLDKDKFNEWVATNFIKILDVNSYKKVVPSKETLYKIIEKGYKHIESQCHYSAKAVSLLDEDFEY